MATEQIPTSIIADDAVTGAKIENNPTVAGNLTVSGTTTTTGALTASGGIANSGTITAGTLGSSVVFPHDGTTDSGRVIQIKSLTSTENNTLNQTWTVRWNFSITLKSSTSKVFVHHTESSYMPSEQGYGAKIYRNDSVLNDSVTSFPSGTKASKVLDTDVVDSGGNPHVIYSGNGALYVITAHIFLDDVSSHFNAGDVVYYGIFYRTYHSTSGAQVPPNTSVDGGFKTIIMEMQK